MQTTNFEATYDDHFPSMIGTHERNELRFFRYLRRHCPTAKDFQVSLRKVFEESSRAVPTVVTSPGVLGGSPSVRGTRVPVYMILDAVQHYGTIKGALKSYPQLTE